MTFKKYNHTNNAFCELLTDLQSSDTTMMLTGNFNRLPASNFIVKISKYQGTKCVARENIYVANRNNNICTGLVRAYEKVPMDDDATENIAQSLNFSAGDIVECVVSSEILNDLQNWLKNIRKIPDMRHQPHKNSQTLEQEHVWYEFRPINTGESGQLSIPWEAGGWAVVETICAWTGTDGDYDLQIAYRVHPRNNHSIYMRSAVSGWDWGEWKRIFPLSWEWIDINGLTEIHNYTNTYDFFVVKEWQGSNKKVTLENLRKWIWNGYGTKNFIRGTLVRSNTSHSIAIPKWWLIHIEYDGAHRYSGWIKVHYSENNSHWIEFLSYYTNGEETINSISQSLFVPSWYIKFQQIGSDTSAKYAVQVF